MRECLECKTLFDAKRERAKFCSVNCRVKWNRKNGNKKGQIKPFQMQSLYNQIVELIENFKTPVDTSILGIKKESIGLPQTMSSTTKKQLGITRSAEQWHELKRECGSLEEWNEVKEQILSAENLSSKQKQIIISTP